MNGYRYKAVFDHKDAIDAGKPSVFLPRISHYARFQS